jgi:hypothetical protein
MKFVEGLKSFSKQSKVALPANTIKFEKQCPHCASRGMFVFNNTSINSKTTNKVKSKDQSQSETVED